MSKYICYTRRKQHYQWFLKKLERKFNRFILLKLMVLISGLTSSVYFLVQGRYQVGGGLLLLGIFLLFYLDHGQRRVIFFQKHATLLRDINEHSLWRLDGRWRNFPDTGAELRDDAHPFTADLDIFGQGSLFQWINATRTYLGRKRLAQLLSSFPEPLSLIRERQGAIKELAAALGWRQRFLAYGTAASDKLRDPQFLFDWVNHRNPLWLCRQVVLGLRILPAITIGSCLLSYYTRLISVLLPVLMVVLQIVLLKVGSKQRRVILAQAGFYEKNLSLYSDLIRQILKRDFDNAYLNGLKGKLFNQSGKSASQQLQKLAKLVDWLTIRRNFLYSIINCFTLLEYQLLIALEQWKAVSGSALKDWLATIAEFEALASLATLQYDHRDWATPQFVPGTPMVSARAMGHPLIDESTRVTNNIQLGKPTKAMLITGSNMSGKSTYLRTVGINLVLAYAGAPVCAQIFQCTPMDIYTCMRVSDNLEKNISSFYAEILRIKTIVAATSGARPVLFLLDEIFKGTNSFDRHTGAKILIKKLIQNGAIGLVSTHDLELGELAQELSIVANYHFQEHFINGQLQFDYQLRPGISQTRNALYLMKAAGINVDEEK